VTSIRPTFGAGGIAAALRTTVTPGLAAAAAATVPAAPAAPTAPPPSAPLPPFASQPTNPLAPPAPASAAPDPQPPAAPAATSFTAVRPALTTINPAILATLQPGILTAPPPIFNPPPPPAQRTVTQLAQDAVAQLRGAVGAALSEAVRTLQAKSIPGKDIMSLLERRTRIGEVLSGSASRWSADTVGDFAAAFQMDATRIGAMDLIVALAVVNDAGVEAELRSENLPPATPQDFLQNRKVVFQYPPPGTELTPPYVILVAVESQDFARADEAVNAIYGQLVDFQGYRMPRDAAARLG
jgi:hypothetical protein